MRPGMIGNFVPLAHGAFENLRVVRRVLPNNEEGRFQLTRRQQVEQLWRECCAWPVVEGQRDIGPLDIHGIKGDLRP
jgi:hypothetical protein